MKSIFFSLIGNYLNLINAMSQRLGAKHSFYVFCYPFKMKITDGQRKFLDTAELFDLELDGNKIQGYKWGTGPKKVLFVHGWRSNTFRWKRYIKSLPREQFTIYAIDAPGHGNSGGKFANVPLFARSIEVISKHVGGFNTIVGHSVGGFASAYYFHNHRNHGVNNFISLAAPGSANDFIDVYLKTLKLSKTTERNLRSYFITYTGKTVEQFDIECTMDNMPENGLIIHDKDDRDVPVSYAHKMKELWPESELEITKGLGHKLRSNEVVTSVVDFISQSVTSPLN